MKQLPGEENRTHEEVRDPRKIAVVGAGNVGATFAYTILLKGMVSEIVLIDVDRKRAEGEAMDLSHAGHDLDHDLGGRVDDAPSLRCPPTIRPSPSERAIMLHTLTSFAPFFNAHSSSPTVRLPRVMLEYES